MQSKHSKDSGLKRLLDDVGYNDGRLFTLGELHKAWDMAMCIGNCKFGPSHDSYIFHKLVLQLFINKSIKTK